jgi:tubulin polyglutamylase TTLL6/13
MNPLRVYVYKDGLARFATVPYKKPDDKNLSNLNMHLTNYAINKNHEDFIANTDKNNDDVGSKRSMLSVFAAIEEDASTGTAAVIKLKKRMNELIIKSLCLATPMVSHLMKSCKPDDIEN